jgi:two-component system sensor histidine kinase BaeS
MAARITLAFVTVLAVALTLAGAVSLLLVRHAASDNTRRLVLQQTVDLARREQTLFKTEKNASQIVTEVLPLISSVAGIRQASIVTTSAQGVFVDAVPKLDFSARAIDTRALAAGHATSGLAGNLAFAAVPLVSADGVHLSFLLARQVSNSDASVSYFVLAGGISLLVAAAAAVVISRRVARRVVAAAGAAEQIASGDFSTRLAASRHDYVELATLSTSLNQMAEHLEDLRDLDRQFLMSVSHDLRTPLTSIRGYAEAIAEGVTPDAARAASVVVAEAIRLERLIGDLLDLARLDAHQFSLHLARVDAGEVVAEAAGALRYECDAAGVALAISIAGELGLEADRDRLGQIVANLTENALKFARSTVEVSCAPVAPDTIALTVTDDGPGIDPADLPRIFERHFSSSRFPARSAGSGLGLAIVAELVAAMHGRIEVISPAAEGHGTRITVSLAGTASAS